MFLKIHRSHYKRSRVSKVLAYCLFLLFLVVTVGPAAGATGEYKTINMLSQYHSRDARNGVVYLRTASERAPHRVVVRNSKLYWSDGSLVNANMATPFVMDAFGEIYILNRDLLPSTALIHHSTFLAGAPIAAAGGMRVTSGVVSIVVNSSGHYSLPFGMLMQVRDELTRRGIDVSEIEFMPFARADDQTFEYVNVEKLWQRVETENQRRSCEVLAQLK